MKNIHLLLIILSAGNAGIAQGVFNNQTNNALEKVVQDYHNQFEDIKGDLLSSKANRAEYKSTINIPGAVSTIVTQSLTPNKQSVSWQSVLYSGSRFDAAKNRFEKLFSQIKNTIIKTGEQKPVIIDGEYTDPKEDKTSTTILFDLLPATGSLQNINIDLMLKSINGEWKIILSVSNRNTRDTEEMVVK